MLRKLVSSVAAILMVFYVGSALAEPKAPAPPTEYGPDAGSLVIVGGGSLAGTGIVEKFIELAGGPDAKFVIVPTAGGNLNADGTPKAYREARVVAPWQKHGLSRVSMLHTHDRAVADRKDFVDVLRDADAVWFEGGRQWHLVHSYTDTRTLDGFRDVLARGGVIGGSSAGATIQGDYLVRGATAGPHVMMTTEPEHQKGFAFLRRSAIDQHVDARDRWDDLIPVMRRFPTFVGLGLSEGTAIVVTRDRFEVMGKGKVAVHDPERRGEPRVKPYFLLSGGDVFDLKSRRAVTPAASEPTSTKSEGNDEAC